MFSAARRAAPRVTAAWPPGAVGPAQGRSAGRLPAGHPAIPRPHRRGRESPLDHVLRRSYRSASPRGRSAVRYRSAQPLVERGQVRASGSLARERHGGPCESTVVSSCPRAVSAAFERIQRWFAVRSCPRVNGPSPIESTPGETSKWMLAWPWLTWGPSGSVALNCEIRDWGRRRQTARGRDDRPAGRPGVLRVVRRPVGGSRGSTPGRGDGVPSLHGFPQLGDRRRGQAQSARNTAEQVGRR